MSLTIIKAGILDTIQDTGRFGYQHLGINPGGAMDRFSACLSNCLLGKEMSAAVLEMHFPAASIRFSETTIICITGADFQPVIDEKPIPLNQPILIYKDAVLEFKKLCSGVRCYLSVLQNFLITTWLGSYSTNLKAGAGGFQGSALKTGDVIDYKEIQTLQAYGGNKSHKILPWMAIPGLATPNQLIEVIEGKEWSWLTEAGKRNFLETPFKISNVADRMGYRVEGKAITTTKKQQLVSSGVSFGTIQFLPTGQLIVLMADHQTTGGYPRLANVISAHLPVLAQMKPNEQFTFQLTSLAAAEQKAIDQYQYLLSVKHASSYKIKELIA